MVIDSSALIAILFREPERDVLATAIDSASTRLMSAMSKLETSIVVAARRTPAAVEEVDSVLRRLAVEIVPFDDRQADIARDAFARYGKGRHPAGLNFGDCASYALAVAEAEPLLFKGTDFQLTDVSVVELPDG